MPFLSPAQEQNSRRRRLQLPAPQIVSRRFCFKKFDPEFTALSFGRFHAQGPLHFFYRLFDNSQPNSRARIAARWIDLLKHFENSLLVFGGDTDAVVDKFNAYHMLAHFGLYLNLRTPIRGYKFDRVRKKIGDYLSQSGFVSRTVGNLPSIRMSRLPWKFGYC